MYMSPEMKRFRVKTAENVLYALLQREDLSLEHESERLAIAAAAVDMANVFVEKLFGREI